MVIRMQNANELLVFKKQFRVFSENLAFVRGLNEFFPHLKDILLEFGVFWTYHKILIFRPIGIFFFKLEFIINPILNKNWLYGVVRFICQVNLL